MSRVGLIRLLVIGGFVLLLEVLCRTGAIRPRMLSRRRRCACAWRSCSPPARPPREIVKSWAMSRSRCVLSVIVGFAIGALIHGLPRLRATLDPLFATYYAIPVFAFYPLFIVIFGLGAAADRADRLPARRGRRDHRTRSTASTACRACCCAPPRVHRLSPVATACTSRCPMRRRTSSPASSSRSRIRFIGVIGAEFIMARRARLRDRLRLQQFRQRHDVSADPVRDRAASTTVNTLFSLWEKSCWRGGR